MVAEPVFFPHGSITCEDANQVEAMAMAVQQQQGNQGDYAALAAAMATPGGAAPGVVAMIGDTVHSGQTPNAKRPVNKDTIAVAGGGSRPMSMDDLIGGFHNIANLQQRDDKYVDDISKVVAWNASLLNALVSRVNGMEANVGRAKDELDEPEDADRGIDGRNEARAGSC